MHQSSILVNRLTVSTNLSSIDPAEWVSQAEAARLRGVSRQAIAKLVVNGRLKTLDVGGRTLVHRDAVLAFERNPAGRPKSTLNV